MGNIQTDALGSLLAYKPAAGRTTVMAAAHVWMKRLDGGSTSEFRSLRFKPVGGIDRRVLVAKEVLVGQDKIPGVIGSKPIHLQKRNERNTPLQWQELYIDIGAKDRAEAEKLVPLGTAAVFATSFRQLSDDIVMGKAFDDRVGCTVLLELLKEEYDCNLVVPYSQEKLACGSRSCSLFHRSGSGPGD